MRCLYRPYCPFIPILLPRVCPQSALKEVVAILRLFLSLETYCSPSKSNIVTSMIKMMKSSVEVMILNPFEMIPDKDRVVFFC